MIWHNLAKAHDIPDAYQSYLERFSNDWFFIQLGKFYDIQYARLTDIICYQVVNRHTGVIEFQTQYLWYATGVIKGMTKCLTSDNENDSIPEPPPGFGSGFVNLIN